MNIAGHMIEHLLLRHQLLGVITLTTTGSQVIPSSVLSSSTLGNDIVWDGDITSDFGLEVFDPAAPTIINMPQKARFVMLFASLSFYPNATGQRWIRILNSAGAHYSNFMMNACGVLTTQLPISPGIIMASAGFSAFRIAAAQNSGVDLTILTGLNQGGSTFCRAAFFS